MSDFKGLNVVVTGASTGLGAAVAIGAARKGAARVLVNYAASREPAEETAKACREAGAEVVVVQGDVSKDEDCRRIAEAVSGWGHVDALINNAGTTKLVPHHDLDGLTAEDFQRIYGVNTVGPFQMVRALRKLLEASRETTGRAGAVVNVSSNSAITGLGSSVAYVSSKGALNTMTIALARALAPAIRVNAVCPGYMDTPWFVKGAGAAAADRMRESVKRMMPLGEASTGEDIADVVLFLAGPASRHMTGEIVAVDAGARLLTPMGLPKARE